MNSINNDKSLIYDYENGYIVDQGTGEVVGVIYDYDIPSHGEWVEEQVVREDRAVKE
ncbi:MAG: hypothetical protein QXS70_05995 [Desulfurococcaceae archaeon]